MERTRGTSQWVRLTCVIVLSVAMGYMEASVVVYLREILVPLREVHLPAAVREPLPLLTREQLQEAGDQYIRALAVEVAREPAPVLLLLAMAWGFARRRGERTAFFIIGFALWDIFYYVFLKVALDWPASLGTWDVLYLIPTAWVAPVWAPLVVSATLLLTGLVLLQRGGRGYLSLRLLGAWCLVAVGTGLVLTSFFLRRKEAFGSLPARFDWGVFLVGWLLAVCGVVWLLWKKPARRA